MPAWLGAVAPIVASIAGGMISDASSRRRQREANRYNSPAQQIRRLKEAGISPSYFYGGGQGLSSTSPRDAPRIDTSSVANAPLNYIQTEAAMNELKKQKAEIRTLNAQAALDEEKSKFLLSDAYRTEYDPITKSVSEHRLDYSKQWEQLMADHEIKKNQQTISHVQKEIAVATKDNQIKQIAENFALTQAKKKLTAKQTELFKKQLQKMTSQVEFINSLKAEADKGGAGAFLQNFVTFLMYSITDKM